MTDSGRWCKDCLKDPALSPLTRRPTPYPGPRCATHHRAHRIRAQAAEAAKKRENRFRITDGEYWALYEAQGGKCALCQIATGRARRLSVDHDHDLAKLHDHPVDQGCRLCIRGLLCKRCNRWGVPLTLLAVLRALEYLHNPPARKVLLCQP